jgi:archaellum component FlaC
MEMLPLIVEGIENKIKKLIFRNQQLSKENQDLKSERSLQEEKIRQLTAKTHELEDQINKLKVSKVLTGKDNLQARHQINELLREIEKCYVLLNR